MKRTAGIRRDCGGQVMIFLVMVVVVLSFVALWQFDLHKTLFVKARSRNAGDAAALAAARWQGVTLNMIGELNVLQAVVLSDGLSNGYTNNVEAEALHELQARLAFAGPTIALAAAQQAAKNNAMRVDPSATADLMAHAERMRNEYPGQYSAPYGEPGEAGAVWRELAGMLEAVAAEGIAAFPENVKYYRDYVSFRHPLLQPDFYDAVASRNWCWFHFNDPGLLQPNYSWPNLPAIELRPTVDAEIFGLGLRRVTRLAGLPVLASGNSGDPRGLLAALADEGVDPHPDLVQVPVSWYAYHPRYWSSWSAALPSSFPFDGDPRPAADVAGADAAVRVEAAFQQVSPGERRRNVVWTAAAKPLGSLQDGSAPHTWGLVLPGFDEVALIPIDASSAPASGSRPGWGAHIRGHLQRYSAQGAAGLDDDCWYCRRIVQWEDDDFRQEGREWLERFSDRCRIPTGPGPSGGTRRGH